MGALEIIDVIEIITESRVRSVISFSPFYYMANDSQQKEAALRVCFSKEKAQPVSAAGRGFLYTGAHKQLLPVDRCLERGDFVLLPRYQHPDHQDRSSNGKECLPKNGQDVF